MQKKIFFIQIFIYLLIGAAGVISGYTISLNFSDNAASQTSIPTTALLSEKDQGKQNDINNRENLQTTITETAKQYGFSDLNENNWNDFVMAVKTKYLDSFEKKIGVNYFQIITMSGDITKADRYFSMSNADINKPDIEGVTPIAYAARNLDINAVKTLHRNGADISTAVFYNSKYRQNHQVLREHFKPLKQTPLTMAIIQNDPVNTPQIIRYLLDNGAGFKNGNDYLLQSLFNLEVMDEFLPDILENTDLQKGIIPNSPDINTNAVSKIFQYDKTGTAIEFLFEKGLSPEMHEDKTFPVLIAAIGNKKNSPEIINMLVDAGFDVNKAPINPKNNTIMKSMTPLCSAINRKDTEIAEILLKNGASVSKEALKKINRLSKEEQNKFFRLFKKYDGELN